AGNDFNIAYEPCTVTVSGVSPSREFRDSTINFVTNGASYKRTDYTVLGVGFESEYGRPQLSEYNAKSASLGYPITVGTNQISRSMLYLKTDVLLADGTVKIALEPGTTGRLQAWLPSWTDSNSYNSHPAELLLDSETRPERYFSLAKWRNIMRRYGTSMRSLAVELSSPEAGSCDFVFEFVSSDGTTYVRDFASQRITSVNPLLLPDYNRDGRIDASDIQLYIAGRTFRYWINECRVVGSVWEEPSLFEGIANALVGLENWRNDHVDGAYDLINLFPVAVNFNPFIQTWGSGVSFKITSESGTNVFNYTMADISHLQAGTIRTAPHVDVNNNPLANATLSALDGNGIPFSRTQALSYGANACLLVAEAKTSSWVGMKMTVAVDGTDMYSCELPIRTSSVDDMFRFVSIRGAHENTMTTFTGTGEPANNPDSDLALKDVFFVHGFNVDFDGARNWNREIFKRFWVSGMNARYWGVTWSGDSGWINGLHYHRDVRQALMSAQSFANLVNQHGHNAVVLGHSLGNMVVSEGLLKGANASTYIMLDAAVASEAYRPELQADSTEITDKYVPSDWDGYHERTWAANWYTWFTNTPNDARADIGWAGHFAPLLERQGLSVYNFYSSGDEVFAEATNTPGIATGVFHWPTLNLEWPFFHLNMELDAFPWQKQEVFKGVNAAGSLSGGWGFHCWTTNMNNETVWVKYSAAGANAMVADGSIVTNAVFDRGVTAMFNPAISDYDKADILAFHVPAISSPAGKVPIRDSHLKKDFNLNASAQRANDWGRPEPSGHPAGQLMPWLHSDIKNMAYYHVYPAFTNIVEKGEMK
ncbi:MAG: alpha/beta hydrolase, partial [Kiritimatiellae bacterium]|nr:alpha/beta hydrolase [Kiritimatiellia bacterium]